MNKNLELLKSKLTPEEFELFEKTLKEKRADYSIEQLCLDEPTIYDMISAAFPWALTEEGHAFWREVSLR